MGRKSLWAFALLVALAVGITPMESAAQVLYGSLVGNVTDSTGAVVPGAAVTITNRETNQSRSTTTSETGAYSFPTIQPGTYDIKINKEGFRTYTRTEIAVTLNTVQRVDIALQVGTVSEAVTVTAETPPLQSDTAQVKAELGTATLEHVPVPVGRNYQNLMRVIPGVRPPSNAHSVPTNPGRALTFNVNGVSQSINNTRIDGASNNNPWLPHISSFVPTLDAIETVNIVTNSFDAEQGLAGGAAINVQIKSGTNNLHGTGFWNHTNNDLKAKQFFLPLGQQNPKLVNNEFGGTFGGPIKKNKLFYFMSYEGNLNREFASRFGTVPTELMRSGDFSSYINQGTGFVNCNETPRSGCLYDPLTGSANGQGRTAFVNNRIPTERIDPIVRRLIALTPLPNVPGLGNRFSSNNYYAGASYLFDRHRADTKINWTATDKFNMYSRFSLLHYDMVNPQMFGEGGGPEISGAGGNPGNGFGDTYSLTIAGNYLIRPNFIMDAYFGWTRFETSVEQGRLDEKIGLDVLGIPGTNGTRRFEGGWPRFDISSFTTLGHPNDFMPYYRSDPQRQFVSNFNWTKGTHEFRFGFDIYFTGMNHTQPEATGALHGAQGGFTFGGGPTALNGGGVAPNEYNSYATFMLGLPTAVGKITMVPDRYSTRQWNYSWYARDRWNVNRKLTLSYGIRWEYFPFPTRSDRGLEWYDGSINKMYICGIGSVPEGCGIGESMRRFAPRLGVAYRASDTFVIRAGYGITNDPFSLQRPLRTNYPVLLIQNITADSFQFTSRLRDGIPIARAPELGSGIIDVPSTFAVVTVPKEIQRGYIQSWNLTLQKQLRWGFTGQVGYVATRSTGQLGYLDLNAGNVIGAGNAGRPLNARFGRTAATNIVTKFGTAQFDSLQASLERRFSAGLMLSVGYTWSKAIGYNENSDSGPNRTHALQYWELNRALMPYDRTHNLQITNVWQLPFGRNKRWVSSGVGAAVLGGWEVNNLLSFYSGTPFTITAPGTSLNMPGTTQTADQVKEHVEIFGGAGRGIRYFDTTAFVPVTQARFGNVGFRSMRGPGIVNWDFGITRNFTLTERWRMEFRAESFNFTNTPHFANPNGDVNSSNFGQITGVTNLGRDGFDERQFRLGLKLVF